MASLPSATKTLHVSPSSTEHTYEPVGGILSQGGCQTHDQMLGPEHSVMEMSEGEYTHLQHLIQAHMEAHNSTPDVPDARPHPAAVMLGDAAVINPLTVTTTQAIDLSTSTDDQCVVMLGEKTPASYGEVPDFVLARVRGKESPTEPSLNSCSSSQKRSRSAARVCLEKRFNTLTSDTPRQQDFQSVVLSNFWTVFQQSAEVQEAATCNKWMKSDRANPFEVSSPFAGGVVKPVTNMCEQVIGHIPHMVEPKKRQRLIIPKNFSFHFHPERVVAKNHCAGGSKPTEEQNKENDVATQPVKASSAGPDSSDSSSRKTPHMSLIQRREKHNNKERERRKRIRSYCDELNMLVPFCESDTDKATTLQWTTAFLRYINKMYGDKFKEEFLKTFSDSQGQFLVTSLSSEVDKSPLAVEQ